MAVPALSPGSYSESRDSLKGETSLLQSLGLETSTTTNPNTNFSLSSAIYFQAAPKLPKFSKIPNNATTLWADAMEKYFWITAGNSSPVDCSVKILQVTLACDIQATFCKRAVSGTAGQEQMSCVTVCWESAPLPSPAIAQHGWLMLQDRVGNYYCYYLY